MTWELFFILKINITVHVAPDAIVRVPGLSNRGIVYKTDRADEGVRRCGS